MSLCCYCSSLFLRHHLQSECFCVVSGPLCVITCNLNVSVLLLVLSLSSPAIRMCLCCYWSSICRHLQSESVCAVTGPLSHHLQSECFCVVTGPLSVVTWNQNVFVLLLVLSLSSPAITMSPCLRTGRLASIWALPFHLCVLKVQSVSFPLSVSLPL